MTEGASKSGNLITRRFVDATRYSKQGLAACFRTEVYLGVVLTPVALWLATSGLDLVLLLGSMLLVLIVELLNSSLEALADLHGLDHNELIGRAKDQGSAAVLLSIVLLFLAWSVVIWQRFV